MPATTERQLAPPLTAVLEVLDELDWLANNPPPYVSDLTGDATFAIGEVLIEATRRALREPHPHWSDVQHAEGIKRPLGAMILILDRALAETEEPCEEWGAMLAKLRDVRRSLYHFTASESGIFEPNDAAPAVKGGGDTEEVDIFEGTAHSPSAGWRLRLEAIARRIDNEPSTQDALATGAVLALIERTRDGLRVGVPLQPHLDVIEMLQGYTGAAAWRHEHSSDETHAPGVASVLRSLSEELEALWRDIARVRRSRETERQAIAARREEGDDA